MFINYDVRNSFWADKRFKIINVAILGGVSAEMVICWSPGEYQYTIYLVPSFSKGTFVNITPTLFVELSLLNNGTVQVLRYDTPVFHMTLVSYQFWHIDGQFCLKKITLVML
jgi:hypothetical protein